MQKLKKGDWSTGACYNCKKIVRTIIRPVIIKNDSGKSEEILKSYCVHCGKVVATPYISNKQVTFA